LGNPTTNAAVALVFLVASVGPMLRGGYTANSGGGSVDGLAAAEKRLNELVFKYGRNQIEAALTDLYGFVDDVKKMMRLPARSAATGPPQSVGIGLFTTVVRLDATLEIVGMYDGYEITIAINNSVLIIKQMKKLKAKGNFLIFYII